MFSRTSGSRTGAIRAHVSRRTFGRTGLFAVIAAVLLVGSPTSAFALEDGEYLMQCSCPVWWAGDWDGNGVFNEDDSLDTIALANGSAVFFMHELPIDAMGLEDYAETRTEALEGNRSIEDVELVWDDETSESVIFGRSWVNADGDTMLGWQVVMVWETNYLLSMEFVAPEDDFQDAWFDTLGDISLVGMPITMITDGDLVMENFGL
jgi:hypothetical protein